MHVINISPEDTAAFLILDDAHAAKKQIEQKSHYNIDRLILAY